MFDVPLSDSHDRRHRSVWLYLVQGLMLSAGTIVLKSLETAVGWNEMISTPAGSASIQLFHVLAIVVVSFLAGSLLQRNSRLQLSGAKWVWIPPVTLLVVAICIDLMSFGFDWGLIWREYFFWSHPGREVGPVLRDLLTYPSLACAAYAAGVGVTSRKQLMG